MTVSASDLGDYVRQGCPLKYLPSPIPFNATLRGLMVENVIIESLNEAFHQNFMVNLAYKPPDSDFSQFVDRVLAKSYYTLQNYALTDLRALKDYLMKATTSMCVKHIFGQLLSHGIGYPHVPTKIISQKTLKGKIKGQKVIARADVWQQIGLQVIIGEIKDRMWRHPFPNAGDYVQTLLAAQLASQQGFIVQNSWIFYVPVPKLHSFSLYQQSFDLISETLLRFKSTLPPNSCDWCKSLFKRCPQELISGGGKTAGQ